MKKFIPFLIACSLAVPLAHLNAAADPFYLKIDGIDGESTSASHKDWIIIQSISMDVARPGAAGQPTFGDIVIIKELDKASPKLMEACATGRPLNGVAMEMIVLATEGEERVAYEVKLEDVLITSFQLGQGGSSSRVPTEELTLNYEEIKLSYGGIRKTVFRYDENGNIAETISVGLVTRIGGTIPPEDEVPPGGSVFDSMSISANEAEALEVESEGKVAG